MDKKNESETQIKAILLHQKAIAYLSEKKLDEAIAFCQQALTLQPNLAAVYKTLGITWQLKGQLQNAQKFYEHALKINPNFAEVYANLGSLHAQQQQWQHALNAYGKALNYNPKLAGVYRNIAQIFRQINQPQNAIQYEYQALQIEPNTATAEDYFKLGQAFEEHKQLNKALTCYKQTIKLDGNFFLAYHHLGFVLSLQSQFEEARLAYQNAIQLKPDFSWSYQGLGETLYKLNRQEEAVFAYQKAIQLNPIFYGFYYQLGESYYDLNQWDEALEAYKKCIQLNPDTYEILYKLSEALIRCQKWNKAITVYSEILKFKPKDDWLYNAMGNAYIKLEQWQDSITAYQTAIEIKPNNTSYYAVLEKTIKNLADFSAILDGYRQTLEKNPNAFWHYPGLAQLLLQQGKYEESIQEYQNAIKINPNFYWAYFSLAKVLMGQQNWEEATFYLLEALKINPDHPENYFLISDILEKQGYVQDASICKLQKKIPKFLLKNYNFEFEEKITTTNSVSNLKRFSIYPKNSIQLFPPKLSIGKFDAACFRDTGNLMEAFVALIPNGRVWGGAMTSAVITAENQLLMDVSMGSPEIILNSKKLPDPVYLKGRVAFLCAQYAGGYFHWLVDVLPRFHLIQKSHISLEEIDFFIINKYYMSYEKESLKLLNIPSEKIIASVSKPHLEAEELIVPSHCYSHFVKPAPWMVNFLRDSFLKPCSSNCVNLKQDRIYITRQQAIRRRIINELEVQAVLEPLGFKTVILESMSFQEQVNCLANAEVVVGLHGAGFTNLVFCQPGTTVIEILSPTWLVLCYWELSNVCNLNYYCLRADSIASQAENQSVNDLDPRRVIDPDVHVNIDSLKQLLKVAEVT